MSKASTIMEKYAGIGSFLEKYPKTRNIVAGTLAAAGSFGTGIAGKFLQPAKITKPVSEIVSSTTKANKFTNISFSDSSSTFTDWGRGHGGHLKPGTQVPRH